MGHIFQNYGTNLQKMTVQLLEKAEIYKNLNPSMRICIKPNLVVSRPSYEGATTHIEIIEGILQYLQEHHIYHITIAESSWVGDSALSAFGICGYQALADKYHIPLIDMQYDPTFSITSHGQKIEVCQSIINADYLINVPVLKPHSQMNMSNCLKNMMGCISSKEKRYFHTFSLARSIGALSSLIRPHLHVIDNVCGDLAFEEGGNPVAQDRILLGTDPLLLDSYCAGLLGFEPEDIPYLDYAHSYKVGTPYNTTTTITTLNNDNFPKNSRLSSRIGQELAVNIMENKACATCYAALLFALKRFPWQSKKKIKIGKGYSGEKIDAIGIGDCTAAFSHSCKGCPPRAIDIVHFLKEMSV